VVGTVILVLSFLTDGFTSFEIGNVGALIFWFNWLAWFITFANGGVIAVSIIILRAIPTLARGTVLSGLGALAFLAGAAWVARAQRREWRRRQLMRALKSKAHPNP
jgi:hypothetical protein